MKDDLSVVRKAGLWGLWLGVEDMSGTLIKKGQSREKTAEVFAALRGNGIFPIPMLMHHDSQPLYTWKDHRGLLNQIGWLRKSGAVSVQVMMLTPSPGSKLYVDTYASGLAYESVGGLDVEPYIVDGNHVVASRHPKPWHKQLNLWIAYLYFYNPLRFLLALVCSKTKIFMADGDAHPTATPRQNDSSQPKRSRRILRKLKAHFGDAAVQAFRMWGVLHNIRCTMGWIWRLRWGKIKRHTQSPASQIPMRSIDGSPASHALPGTPIAQCKSSESKPESKDIAAVA